MKDPALTICLMTISFFIGIAADYHFSHAAQAKKIAEDNYLIVRGIVSEQQFKLDVLSNWYKCNVVDTD